MKSLREKLDKEERVNELNPKGTLERIGLKNSDVFCDIGAGTGVFTLPAAKITSNHIYALDIKEEMLNIIKEKANNENIKNIKTLIVDSSSINVPNSCCDIAFMSTVLHEIDDKDAMLGEIHRLLNENGKLAIIEFHKKDTTYGPPINEKIAPIEMDNIIEKSGFEKVDYFELSDKFYCKVYKKSN